jgi:CheY-like chemotaxis protein
MAKSLKGIRILIAEDNPFNQMIAQDDLSYYIEDITIETVENGVFAIEKFKTNTFDLILMDVQMPEINGFEATKRIREIEKSEGRTTIIPIIAMTASLLKTEINSCYNAGMNSYIPKPYKIEELIVPIFNELKS